MLMIQVMIEPIKGSRKKEMIAAMIITKPPTTLTYNKPSGPNRNVRIKADLFYCYFTATAKVDTEFFKHIGSATTL